MDKPFPHEIFAPIANLLARVGDGIILPIYRRPNMQVEIKADYTPVTEADGKAESELRKRLAEMFPGTGFIGEETEGKDWRKSPLLHEENGLWVPDRGRKVFIMDPVDGTINFAMGPKIGRPFATMLAMFDQGEFAASWIYFPLSGECLFTTADSASFLIARQSGGAWSEPRVVHVPAAQKRPINMEFLIYRLLKDQKGHAEEGQRLFGSLVEPAGHMQIMTCIAECLYNMVVKGELDMTVSPSYTSPWDLWTTGPVFEHAGAIVTSETGNHYRACTTQGCIVARDIALAVKVKQIIAMSA